MPNVIKVWDTAQQKYVPIPLIKGDKGEQGPRGYSGLLPQQSIDYSESIIIPANIKCVIKELIGPIDIILSEGLEDYDNEWAFVIKQTAIKQEVILPQIEWTLGIAPTFMENTSTEIRLFYKGDTLCGIWL